MNRHDEIQAKARDIASNIHADPGKRNQMADDLIELVGIMLAAQGKYVAIRSEQAMNDAPSDQRDEDGQILNPEFRDAAGAYVTGEWMQQSARELVPECTNPGVDLDRWREATGREWCVCGHRPDSHEDGRCIGETHNKHACNGGPCTGFVAQEPTGGWVHEDRRPEGLQYAAVLASQVDPSDTACCGGPVADLPHVCQVHTGPCCYSNDEICPQHM